MRASMLCQTCGRSRLGWVVLLGLGELLSVTWMVTAYPPCPVTWVALTTPVAGLRLIPSGRLMPVEDTTDHLYGGVPPVAAKVVE